MLKVLLLETLNAVRGTPKDYVTDLKFLSQVTHSLPPKGSRLGILVECTDLSNESSDRKIYCYQSYECCHGCSLRLSSQ